MPHKALYCAGKTPALHYAEHYLQSNGIPIIQSPNWNTGHLLLDVPSFKDNSTLRTGGNIYTLLESLPKDILIWGGNLNCDALETYTTIDLLQDETYLRQNAAITADCAIKIAAPLLKTTWQDSPTLILGWGRIGKSLSQILKSIKCPVTVAARSERDRYILKSLGFDTSDVTSVKDRIGNYRILFNTIPEPIIDNSTSDSTPNCIKIDLASCRGIEGENVVWARGLPGIHAPESSGKLIAETFLRLWKEMEA